MSGQRLKELFEELELTTMPVANYMGITNQAIHAWFGYKNIGTDNLETLCKVFNLKMNDFYKDTEYAVENESTKTPIVSSSSDLVKRFEELVLENAELRKRLSQYEVSQKVG